jgi:hypothetical protein
MTAEGIALILGAVATLVTSIATAVVLILKRDVTKVKDGLGEVHALVNQNRTDMLQYQNDLIMVLQKNEIIVPRDRSTVAGTGPLPKPDGRDTA